MDMEKVPSMTFKQISYSVEFAEFTDAIHYLAETIDSFKNDGYTIQKAALKTKNGSEAEKVGFRSSFASGEKLKTYLVKIQVWRKP
ncbi:hypothetical protein M3M39_05030 [Fructilactobacillus hinvesii]|uniref:Uncharacterized protein n=1 Tax=Fructilactobacillus hinvesii TaxID=2940300 RepID=A0ABY5BQW4_9LACO|nr:hypothetical protein [Fructilactobacillus hinvesii]USS87487.1 hypothetical protein M3M39_05030 [Fructilactobacillus hinvesii]